VANGLSYYDYTFLRELPRFYAALEDQLASTDPAWDGFELPSFLRVGSWIGGDSDCNPRRGRMRTAETRLRGWACKTRTQKCRRKLSL